MAHRSRRAAWLVLFLLVALLWNPLVPLRLRGDDWFFVCAAATVALVLAAFFLRPAAPERAAA